MLKCYIVSERYHSVSEILNRNWDLKSYKYTDINTIIILSQKVSYQLSNLT